MATPYIDTIILLTGLEEAKVLGRHLKTHNPKLNIVPTIDRDALDKACKSGTSMTRLISFCSPVIVPASYLIAIPFGSYNFHPGPPTYPGRYPSVFALHEEACNFGATFHLMSKRVDEGPIIAADYFTVPDNCHLEQLDTLTFKALLGIFVRYAKHLATDSSPLKPQQIYWSGKKRTKSDCDMLCQIEPTMSGDEKARRKRACGVHLQEGS